MEQSIRLNCGHALCTEYHLLPVLCKKNIIKGEFINSYLNYLI